MIKHLFYKIHKPIIHEFCCTYKYPWGWMPPVFIDHLKNKKEIKYDIHAENDVDCYFYEYEFCEGSKQAYYTIFEMFKNRKNFLYTSYASPSLSIAMNDLHSFSSIRNVCIPKIKNVHILDHWIEHDYTFRNHKLLGMWNETELKHLICSGIVGPEINYIWSQMPVKQIVKVHYVCENREDVWYFERCLFEKDTMWQIKNINGILIET